MLFVQFTFAFIYFTLSLNFPTIILIQRSINLKYRFPCWFYKRVSTKIMNIFDVWQQHETQTDSINMIPTATWNRKNAMSIFLRKSRRNSWCFIIIRKSPYASAEYMSSSMYIEYERKNDDFAHFVFDISCRYMYICALSWRFSHLLFKIPIRYSCP